ncbi:winged helix-turn-helix domain-containing protein [Nonomuraea fuscirosea]|uniref:winged helix-turn-helix domain-containing protein n=1 Tax=Nonomuraea fuscirosea TaxID=1291556 RepID=UPI00340407B9
MLLRAMAVAARTDQGVTPAFGTRQLARMTGLDHTTVAKHLKRLREELHPLIERIVPGQGKQGARYQLVVP